MGRLKSRRTGNAGAHADAPLQASSHADSPLPNPHPTILIAADSNNTLARLRETFPAQEHNPITGNRRYRVLRGSSNKPAYRLVSLRTGGRATDLVPELAWYAGILWEPSAVLLVGRGPEFLLADRLRASADRYVRSHRVEQDDEYLPDLIVPLPPTVPVGTISDNELLACARWLTTRFGPHQVWALHLSNDHSAEQEKQTRPGRTESELERRGRDGGRDGGPGRGHDSGHARGRRHRLLREVLAVLATQTLRPPADSPEEPQP